MKRVVWITGAHGFIGRHVALAAAKQDMTTVLGIGHGYWSSNERERWGIATWINGDINQMNLNTLLAVSGPPDVVIHLAGGSSVAASIANPHEDFFRTVVSSINLLEWLRSASPETSLVVASSAAVYGANQEGPISESTTLNPYSPYGHHKLMMESLCHSYATSFGLQSVIARLFSVYGVGLQKQLLWDICNRLKNYPETLDLSGTGDEVRDWVDVFDVADVLANLGSYASVSVPIFNVGSGLGTSVREIAQIVIDNWRNCGGNKIELNFSGQSRKGDPVSLIADSQHLATLGLKCLRPVREGVMAYIDWWLTHDN